MCVRALQGAQGMCSSFRCFPQVVKDSAHPDLYKLSKSSFFLEIPFKGCHCNVADTAFCEYALPTSICEPSFQWQCLVG